MHPINIKFTKRFKNGTKRIFREKSNTDLAGTNDRRKCQHEDNGKSVHCRLMDIT
ncbi:hypothetical protein JXL19_01355 [bacterium]|nr:hypothetical protein [bacterium]